MATYYVSSVDGSDVDTGASWALAKATVAGALAAATADGDIILVDSAHAFSAGAGISWNPSANIEVAIISVNRAGGDAHLAGAAESVGASSSDFTVNTSTATLYIEGMTLNSGTTGSGSITLGYTSNVARIRMKNCTLKVLSAGGASAIKAGLASRPELSLVELEGCTLQLANNATGIGMYSHNNVRLRGCTVTLTGSSPSTLFRMEAGTGALEVIDCNLVAYTGADLVMFGGYGHHNFANCKLHSTPALQPASWTGNSNGSVTYVNCDSGDTTYKFNYYTVEGALTTNIATYANDGATVDGNLASWQIVTTAGCDEDSPFYTPWVSTWIDSTGSKTLSLELVYDSASNLDDREVWAEFEYLGDASFTLGTIVSSRNTDPFTGTGTDLTAGAATWTETLTNDNKDKIATTVTVNQKGLARARLIVGKASQTLYLDPQLRVA